MNTSIMKQAMLNELGKIAALGARTILPTGASAAGMKAVSAIPKAAPIMASGAAFKGEGYISPTLSGAAQNAATVPPRRMAAAPPSLRVVPPSNPHSDTIPASATAASAPTMRVKVADMQPPSPSRPLPMRAMAQGPKLPRPGGMPLPKLGSVIKKVAAELTPAARAELPKKDFAVSAKKSNTGERAYPIPDRRHAASALGFAKMHGDTADYERVKSKVMAKYPDLIKKGGFAESAGKAIGGKAGDFIVNHHNAFDLAGLGTLAVAPAASMAHQVHNATTGKEVNKGELAREGAEVGGLGILAAPGIVHALRAGKNVAQAIP